ncbi:hypothetical protein PV326_001625 [Microctonus aethiopoides]|nr:hypothetical protein PV326_001625 [Microctonus aethiopoides]
MHLSIVFFIINIIGIYAAKSPTLTTTSTTIPTLISSPSSLSSSLVASASSLSTLSTASLTYLNNTLEQILNYLKNNENDFHNFNSTIQTHDNDTKEFLRTMFTITADVTNNTNIKLLNLSESQGNIFKKNDRIIKDINNLSKKIENSNDMIQSMSNKIDNVQKNLIDYIEQMNKTIVRLVNKTDEFENELYKIINSVIENINVSINDYREISTQLNMTSIWYTLNVIRNTSLLNEQYLLQLSQNVIQPSASTTTTTTTSATIKRSINKLYPTSTLQSTIAANDASSNTIITTTNSADISSNVTILYDGRDSDEDDEDENYSKHDIPILYSIKDLKECIMKQFSSIPIPLIKEMRTINICYIVIAVISSLTLLFQNLQMIICHKNYIV